MPVRRVNSGGSSPRALESAPVAGSIALEISVEHGHRTEAESLDGLQPFSSEIEGIAGITDEDITAEEISVAISSFLEKFSGMFERW